jgi:hypothetical protein
VSFVFGVGEATATRWKYNHERNGFPLADGYISRNVPYWYPSTLRPWGLVRVKGRIRWPGDSVVAARLAALAERDAARRANDEARAAEIERQALALREVAERRADADRARQRLAALQAEVEAAEAAAADAERRANPTQPATT